MLKRIALEAGVGAFLFTVISVLLEGSYNLPIWLEKATRGLLFGTVYGIFLFVNEKFIKKKT